jgi:hypothetical protein
VHHSIGVNVVRNVPETIGPSGSRSKSEKFRQFRGRRQIQNQPVSQVELPVRVIPEMHFYSLTGTLGHSVEIE